MPLFPAYLRIAATAIPIAPPRLLYVPLTEPGSPFSRYVTHQWRSAEIHSLEIRERFYQDATQVIVRVHPACVLEGSTRHVLALTTVQFPEELGEVPGLDEVEDVDVRADPATGAVESGILGTGLLDTHGGDAVEGQGGGV
jgi:hypothetical protein